MDASGSTPAKRWFLAHATCVGPEKKRLMETARRRLVSRRASPSRSSRVRYSETVAQVGARMCRTSLFGRPAAPFRYPRQERWKSLSGDRKASSSMGTLVLPGRPSFHVIRSRDVGGFIGRGMNGFYPEKRRTGYRRRVSSGGKPEAILHSKSCALKVFKG